MKKSLLLFLLLSALSLHAQVNPALEQQARSLIASKGLDETEVRARLKARGIDIDNVTPEQLPGLQPAIEAVIKEMENEREGTPAMEAAPPAAPAAATPTPNPIKPAAEPAAAPKEPGPPAKIYGQQLFRDKSIALFQSGNDVKPPDTYILSTGDALTISVFGASQFDSRFEINREGYIQPTRMPKIFLKGLPLGQAKALLQSRFAQQYRFAPEQFAVSLSTARNISVNIFGETANSGSFSMPAVNTAFNALVAAGGPSDIGSVRNIKVIRGKNTRILDVYQFIKDPTVQYDFFLEDNDIIYVPVAAKVVAIRGAVNRPYDFELTGDENLRALLDFAGGMTANAYREIIQIKRFDNARQVLLDVDWNTLQANNQDFPLRNGDEIVVRAIPAPVENTAAIEGAVELPGAYALTETPRISDLIRKGVLRLGARTDLAFLLRKNPDGSARLLQVNIDAVLAAPGTETDLPLQAQDQLSVYAQARFTDLYTISVVGAVRAPLNNYPFSIDSAITLRRAVLLAGGLKPEATGQGYILRTDPANTKVKTFIPVDIKTALDKPGGPANLLLHPSDSLAVFSALNFTDAAEVSVAGAVRTPGKFPFSASLQLKDVLLLAGGMRMEAATNRIDVYRVQFANNQPTRTLAISVEVDRNYNISGGGSGFVLQPFDEIVVRSVPDFEFQQFVELNGEVKYPGRYALTGDNEPLSSLIGRAGGLSPEADETAATLYRTENNKGFVVTRLDKALRAPGSSEDHVLKNGDLINIPKRQDLVTIKGGNTQFGQMLLSQFPDKSQISVAYHKGRRAGWYIKEYTGGFAKDAHRKKVTVEQPNGKVNRTTRVLFVKIYPKVSKGSVVYVPTKPPKHDKEGKEKKNIDWDKKLTQIIAFTSIVTSAILAYATIKSLNQ